MSDRTLVLLKPDAVRRGLIGEIVGRLEAKQLSIVAMVVEGSEDTWEIVRGLMGATNPRKAAPGTIRGDLASANLTENLVHGSDSLVSAEREVAIFFPNL